MLIPAFCLLGKPSINQKKACRLSVSIYVCVCTSVHIGLEWQAESWLKTFDKLVLSVAPLPHLLLHLHLDKKYIRLELITVSGAAKPHSKETHTHTTPQERCLSSNTLAVNDTLNKQQRQHHSGKNRFRYCVCVCVCEAGFVCRENDVRYGLRIC